VLDAIGGNSAARAAAASERGPSALSQRRAPAVGNVFVQPLDDSPSKQVTGFTTGRIRDFAWAPRGHKLVISRSYADDQAYVLRNVPIPRQSR